MTLSTINPLGMREEPRRLIGMVLIPFGEQRDAISKLHRD